MASEFARMNKPKAIEEFLDTYLIRPLGYLLVQGFRHTQITPNMVSVASVFAGIGAALFYYERTLQGATLGGLFLLLSSALDSADGQLARATGRKTEFGRLVDGVCDNLSFIAIYLSALLSYFAAGGQHGVLLFFAGLFGGASHSIQSALTDYQRLLYLYYFHGQPDVEKEAPETLARRRRELTERGEQFLYRALLLRSHINYARQQRGCLPSSDKLFSEYRRFIAQNPGKGPAFLDQYRRENGWLLPRWALLGSNSHKIGIVLCSFLPFFAPWEPLRSLGLATFFLYNLLLLNTAMVFLILAQRKVDQRLLAWLKRQGSIK